jgi:general secretion pathway protein K
VERGIALVVVLWTVTLLAIIAASFAYTVRIESTLAANVVGRAKARALAEAGIAYAVFDLLRPIQLRRFTPDGAPYPWDLGAGAVIISIRDAGGLIDLNTASRELLGGLLAAAGIAEENRNPLLDAIEDWRDPDNAPRLQGAEDEDYIAAGLPYGAKDGPFEDVAELQQVLGISLELYQRIENLLTVFSQQSGINPAAAPREVLLSVPGIDPRLIEAYLEERRVRRARGEVPPLPPIGGGYVAQAEGLAYSVRAEARIEGGGMAIIEAVVSPGSNVGSIIPYSSVLEWRESL